jgi:pimeloyl-ACP methyl ester carboxylesterase
MSGGAQISFHPDRGELIDIGGRRLRLIRAGVKSDRPTILCESGAFGFGSDWAVVQERLAAKGLYSLAYDRAGLGFSDPGPNPRDGHAIMADLETLLERAGEAGPFVLVGHSMAGLFVPLFAARNPEKVVGVVLVDAVTPETIDKPSARVAIRQFGHATRVWGAAAGLGLSKPLAPAFGDRIGVTGEAAKEKRRVFATANHHRVAAEEVRNWPVTSEQARLAGGLDPDWPVAVVTARAEKGLAAVKAVQAVPARRSRAGYIEHVANANHANLLGEAFADPIVHGVEHVLKAAGY